MILFTVYFEEQFWCMHSPLNYKLVSVFLIIKIKNELVRKEGTNGWSIHCRCSLWNLFVL